MELKTHSMQTVSALACGKQIKRECCSRIGEDFGSLIRNRCDHAVCYLTMERAHRVTELRRRLEEEQKTQCSWNKAWNKGSLFFVVFFTFFKNNFTNVAYKNTIQVQLSWIKQHYNTKKIPVATDCKYVLSEITSLLSGFWQIIVWPTKLKSARNSLQTIYFKLKWFFRKYQCAKPIYKNCLISLS